MNTTDLRNAIDVPTMAPTQRDTLREHARKLEQAMSDILRPELDAWGMKAVYIVLASETTMAHSDHWIAHTSPLHSAIFKTAIGERWRGLGPCQIVNDYRITGMDFDASANAMSAITSISAHEFAHVVFARRPYEHANTESKFLHLVEESNATPCWKTVPQLVDDHDADFLRACFHLSHRLENKGFRCPFSWMHSWRDLAPSGWWNYLNALGDECEKLEGESMTDVALSPMPVELTEIWEMDQLRVAMDQVGKV